MFQNAYEPAGLMTNPDWLNVLTHDVANPSLPQLTVLKLSLLLGGSAGAFSTKPYIG